MGAAAAGLLSLAEGIFHAESSHNETLPLGLRPAEQYDLQQADRTRGGESVGMHFVPADCECNLPFYTCSSQIGMEIAISYVQKQLRVRAGRGLRKSYTGDFSAARSAHTLRTRCSTFCAEGVQVVATEL